MVRAGVVKHPSEWKRGGYAELQRPRRRGGRLDYEALQELLRCWPLFKAFFSMNQPVDVVRPQATLPVLERREEFLAALEQHQVVIVCGETGSGKTTQLPQICLQGGRAADGALIGHTQPRRLAARSVSSRIASEMGTRSCCRGVPI